MNILVEAYLDRNFGDDLFVTMLTEHYLEYHFFILQAKNKGYNLLYSGKNRNIQMISEQDALDKIDQFGAYILVGGDFYPPDYHYEDRPQRAQQIKANQGKVIILGASLYREYPGSSFDPVRKLFLLADAVTFRDRISYNQCKILAPGVKAYLSSDMIFSLPRLRKKEQERNHPIRRLGISVREKIDSVLAGTYEQYCQQMAGLICCYLNQNKENKVSFLVYSMGEWNDLDTVSKIMSLIDLSELSRISVLYYEGNVYRYIEQIDTSCDAMICTRFHSLCMALLLDKPFVPINYEAKVKNLLDSLHYQGLILSYGEQMKEPRDVLSSLHSNAADPSIMMEYLQRGSDFFLMSDLLLSNKQNLVTDAEDLILKLDNEADKEKCAAIVLAKDEEIKAKIQENMELHALAKKATDAAAEALEEAKKREQLLTQKTDDIIAEMTEKLKKQEQLWAQKTDDTINRLTEELEKVERLSTDNKEISKLLEQNRAYSYSLERMKEESTQYIRQIEMNLSSINQIAQSLASLRSYKMAHLLSRMRNQFIFGKRTDKREFLGWLLDHRKKNYYNGNHCFNPLYQLINPLQSLLKSVKQYEKTFAPSGTQYAVSKLAEVAAPSASLHKTVSVFNALLDELKKYKGIKVCVLAPVVDFNISLFQRPQQIALALAQIGIMTVFVTPNYQDMVQTIEVIDGLLVLVPQSEMKLDEILKLINDCGKESILQIYSTDAQVTTEDVQRYNQIADNIVYEYIDEIHEEITGSVPKFVWDRHHMILSDPKISVLSTASRLHQDVLMARGGEINCILSSNGVDLAHFQENDDGPEVLPEDFAGVVAKKKPMIGYYGAIASWFDYQLVYEAALVRPQYEFVLVGPLYSEDMAKKIRLFDKIENVTVCRPINYTDLPKAARHFAITTIPFLVNDITESTSPLKIFEYMAMAKPVVTTEMRECHKYPVYVAQNTKEYITYLDQAMDDLNKPEKITELLQCAENNSWKNKALDLIKVCEDKER